MQPHYRPNDEPRRGFGRLGPSDREPYSPLPYLGQFLPPPLETGESDSSSVVKCWRLVRRNAGTLTLAALLGAAAGLLITIPQTPVYRAETSLEIQNLNENFMNMRDLSPTANGSGFYSPDYDIQTQLKVLQSRAVVLRAIADHPDLAGRLMASNRKGGVAPQDNPDLQGESDREGIAAQAATRLKVRAQPNTRIVEIIFDSTEPKLASDFANAVASAFIEVSLDERWRATQEIGQWLGRQMEDLKIKLEKSDDELQRYARQANLIFTNNSSVSEERLRQLQEELSKAEADRVTKQSKYEQATTAHSESLPEIIDDPILKDYQIELIGLRRQLSVLASTYTPTNPKVERVEAQIATVESALEKKRANIIMRVRNEYAAACRREDLLKADYAAQVRMVTSQAEKVTRYNILKRGVESTRQLYDSMLQRVKEAGVASAFKTSNIHIIDAARIPTRPYKPNHLLNTALGLLLGIGGGVALVLMRERSDSTVQAPGESSLYFNVPELGVIPSEPTDRHRLALLRPGSRLRQPEASARLELTACHRRLSPIAEAFRSAVTSILFSEEDDRHSGVLVVSSPTKGDGKTTTATNLAIALAEANHRVLLVDGDLRHPRLHEIFGMENTEGVSDILAGKTPIATRQTMVPNLFLLPSGGSADANLLFTPQLSELLVQLRADYDTVLIDSPPILLMPDARVLARRSDAIILVIRAQQTSRDAVRLACEQLSRDRTYILGTILNDFNGDAEWDFRYQNGTA